MYFEIIGQMKKQLGQLAKWLDAATAHAAAKKFEPDLFVEFRLAPDQFGFARQVQLACDDVHPLQPGLECGQLSTVLLVLGAERIGPERAESTTTAIEPRAELHPLLEVPAVLLAELLGQVVQPSRVAAQALGGLLADAVEPLLCRARGCLVAHGLPEVRGPV